MRRGFKNILFFTKIAIVLIFQDYSFTSFIVFFLTVLTVIITLILLMEERTVKRREEEPSFLKFGKIDFYC